MLNVTKPHFYRHINLQNQLHYQLYPGDQPAENLTKYMLVRSPAEHIKLKRLSKYYNPTSSKNSYLPYQL